MTILMLGWEFPPKISGGLGVASQGIAEALAQQGHGVTFLLPKMAAQHKSSYVKLVDASNLQPDIHFWEETGENIEKIKDAELGTLLMPYLPAKIFRKAKEEQKQVRQVKSSEETRLLDDISLTGGYEGNLFSELGKYAMLAVQTARSRPFDWVHCHDWITFKAGLMIHKTTGIPFCAHVHSTELDRNGVHAQPHIMNEEKAGLEGATHIFAVSERVKKSIVTHYQIDENKITVVPNAIHLSPTSARKRSSKKTVAFIGRFTDQKGPVVFLDIVRALASGGKNYRYLMIGDGHLKSRLLEKIKHNNLGKKIQFTGFLDREELLKLLPSINLLITPSISEPFGLVMLEAIHHKIPVLATKGTGLAEFIPSLPETPRWDVYNSARLAERLLEDKAHAKEVTKKCLAEAQALSWEKSAKLVEEAYHKKAVMSL